MVVYEDLTQGCGQHKTMAEDLHSLLTRASYNEISRLLIRHDGTRRHFISYVSGRNCQTFNEVS